MGDFVAVNGGNFKQITANSLPVLVEFGAPWCAPCKRLEPILAQLGQEWQGRVILAKVDVDESADLATQFGVMSVPTVILFSGGKLLERVSGLQSRDRLVEKFGPHIK